MANLFHLIILIAGVLAAFFLTRWAIGKGWVNEKYCVALLLFIGFLTYEIIDYDPTHAKWCHPKGSSSLGDSAQTKEQQPTTD